MLNTLWHDKCFADVKGDCPIPQLDVEGTLEHEEKIVGLVMLVPVKRPLELGHHDVVVVVSGDRARGETIGERCELIGEIGGCFHCFALWLAGCVFVSSG